MCKTVTQHLAAKFVLYKFNSWEGSNVDPVGLGGWLLVWEITVAVDSPVRILLLQHLKIIEAILCRFSAYRAAKPLCGGFKWRWDISYLVADWQSINDTITKCNHTDVLLFRDRDGFILQFSFMCLCTLSDSVLIVHPFLQVRSAYLCQFVPMFPR